MRVPFLVFAIGICVLAVPAQEPLTIPVTIHVIDPLGFPVSGAQIRLTPTPDSSARLETDAHGDLTLRLRPRGYALFVSESGFRTFETHVEVSAASKSEFVPVNLRVGATGSPADILPPEATGGLVIDTSPYANIDWYRPTEFAQVPHVSVRIRGADGAEEIYSGVALNILLSNFNAPFGPEFRDRAVVLTVVASGQGQAVFSLAELDPSVGSTQALVADSLNGRALPSDIGPFELVAPSDKTRIRWVPKLHDISLRPLR